LIAGRDVRAGIVDGVVMAPVAAGFGQANAECAASWSSRVSAVRPARVQQSAGFARRRVNAAASALDHGQPRSSLSRVCRP